MHDAVVRLLRCPVCHETLAQDGGTLRCGAGHAYDIARHGYVSLLAGAAPRGDTAAMVAARDSFLSAGHYAWLADLLAARCTELATTCDPDPGVRATHQGGPVGGEACVVDAGAGTGYYLAAVLNRAPGVGVALDSSAYALRRAAKAHPAIGAVRADLWRPLPVRDGVATLILNVFAPRNGPEFRRILAPGGRLVTVTPRRGHLAELIDRLGLLSVDESKQQRLADSLADFTAEDADDHQATLRLDHAAVSALVGMGPSAWHTEPDARAARIAALPATVEVTASCRLTTWRPL
ncbi:MAG: putative RNA methyltransferase [Micromonosporaceae bacterium]